MCGGGGSAVGRSVRSSGAAARVRSRSRNLCGGAGPASVRPYVSRTVGRPECARARGTYILY
jgi:hypothetical protein